MKRVKLIASASALAILGVLATTVGAQQSNTQEVTYLTFSTPVEMPGVVLEPGTYEFRLADTPSRNVVQVYTKGREEIVGQWTFVQSQRPQVSGETVVMFREAEAGTTPAVQYWYFPGEKVGKEFIYPKDQAERIAARTGQTVRSDDGQVMPQSADASTPDAGAQASAGAATAIDNDADADIDRDARADAELSADADRPSAAGAVGTSGRADDDRADVDARADADASFEADADRADASIDADRDAAISADADASVNRADADDSLRDAPASAQPTAPAGSTAGNRAAQSDSAAVGASASAGAQQQPEAQVSTQPQRDVTSTQPQGAQSQVAASQDQQPREADSPRPVGTSGQAQQDQETGQFRGANELPRTASPLALTGLLGLLSLAGAAGIRRFYR